MKDSFVLYADYADHIALLDMEQRGQLLTAIMAYANEDIPPDMDPAVTMAFSFISARMDRDEEKYYEVIEKRREAGRASSEARRQKKESVEQKRTKRTSVQSVEQTGTNATVHVPVPVPVHEPVIKKHIARVPTLEEVREYCCERNNTVDPEAFIAYYESQNWKKANGQPLANWKSAVITWESRDKARGQPKKTTFNTFPQREYSDDEFKALERAAYGSH